MAHRGLIKVQVANQRPDIPRLLRQQDENLKPDPPSPNEHSQTPLTGYVAGGRGARRSERAVGVCQMSLNGELGPWRLLGHRNLRLPWATSGLTLLPHPHSRVGTSAAAIWLFRPAHREIA